MPKLEPLPAVDATALLREVDEALIPLLRGLSPEDWDRAAVGHWSVKDVTAHLLDSALRRLSLDRDRHQPPAPDRDLSDWGELVDFLNELNADWVKAATRLSPQLLIELLEWVDPRVADYFESLDPEAEAAFPVAWAGEATSKVWMDVAREFTERWHHQQQIREAVGAPSLDDEKYVAPLLATFVRSVPRAYAEVEAAPGTRVRIVTDLAGSAWLLARDEEGLAAWGVWLDDPEASAEATIELPAEVAWRLFAKSIEGAEAREKSECSGSEELIAPFFSSLAVMA